MILSINSIDLTILRTLALVLFVENSLQYERNWRINVCLVELKEICENDIIIFVWEEIKAWSTQFPSLKRLQERRQSTATLILKTAFTVRHLQTS